MLKLFRRIRQQLLSENHFSKYLLYAVGEIFLVVIGILIALQINNWNEGRQLKTLEKTTLKELDNSIQADMEELTTQIQTYKRFLHNIKLLRNHVKAKQPYVASLDTLWIYPVMGYQLKPNTSAFDALESRGVELITNQIIRNKITTHYKVTQQRLINNFNLRREMQKQFMYYYFDLIYPQVDEAYIENFDYAYEVQLPHDYQAILDNPLIIGKFNHRMNANIRSIHEMKILIESKKALSLAIKEEIERL